MGSADIRVRDATASDHDTVVAFNLAMAQETEYKALDETVLREGVRRALADSTLAKYFMAEAEGCVVGQTMLTVEWSDWRNGFFWWIQSVYVEPDFRRRGVFRALYQHIRNAAQADGGVRGLRLYVDRDNGHAIETYKQLGMSLSNYLLCEEDWPPPR